MNIHDDMIGQLLYIGKAEKTQFNVKVVLGGLCV